MLEGLSKLKSGTWRGFWSAMMPFWIENDDVKPPYIGLLQILPYHLLLSREGSISITSFVCRALEKN